MVAVAELVHWIALRYATCENRMQRTAVPKMERTERGSRRAPATLPEARTWAAARKSQQAVSSRTDASQSGSMA